MRVPIKFLFRIYLDLIDIFRIRLFAVKWNILNQHNLTSVSRIFPIDIVKVGKGTYGNLNVYSYANGKNEKLEIGNYVSIANSCSFILGGGHSLNSLTTYPIRDIICKIPFGASSKGPIIISDEVWIGFGVTILSGVRVGKGAIIASKSVVTKDIPPYTVFGGNPAKFIKNRFSEDITNELISLNLFELNDEILIEKADVFYEEITDYESFQRILDKIK